MEFNTIVISDGITMGMEGMKTSLVSRKLIADSIALVSRGHMFDAAIALVACDKTISGGAMGLIRLDVPSLVLYGGSIMPGRTCSRPSGPMPPGACQMPISRRWKMSPVLALAPAGAGSRPTPWRWR
jgi:dihydroxyacid dehydratase/phosphogluconate dehydratase